MQRHTLVSRVGFRQPSYRSAFKLLNRQVRLASRACRGVVRQEIQILMRSEDRADVPPLTCRKEHEGMSQATTKAVQTTSSGAVPSGPQSYHCFGELLDSLYHSSGTTSTYRSRQGVIVKRYQSRTSPTRFETERPWETDKCVRRPKHSRALACPKVWLTLSSSLLRLQLTRKSMDGRQTPLRSNKR